MPNSPEPVTGDVARRWTQARMPAWAPWMLVVVSVVGVVLSIATDHTVCSPRDPTVCGPDLSFAWAAAFLVTGLVTLWVWPVAASLLVLGYVGLDLVYDPARPARVAFAVLGFLVLAYATGHVVLRRHQKATMASLAGPAHLRVLSSRSWPRPVGVLVGVACAGLVSGVSGLWYAHQVAETARHVASSVVVDSVAGPVDDDGDQSFALSSPPTGTPSKVSILPALASYPEGSHQPVRVDLQDREWVRLVAEPNDHTDWLSLSIGSGILAVLMLSYVKVRALNRRRLAEVGGVGVGVSVRVIGSDVWVTAADGSHATLATFATSEGQDQLRSRPGVLVGDLRAKGWAAVWTDDSVLLPLSRLSVEGGPEAMTDAAAESLLRSYVDDEEDSEDVDLGTVGEEVTARREAPGGLFPMTDGPPPWLRAVGAVLAVGAAVIGPYAALTWTERLADLWPVVVLGGTALERGVRWWSSGLLVTPQGARVDSGFFVRMLPFAAVDSVRIDGETVVLLADEDAVTFEPCQDVNPLSVRLECVREVAEVLRGLVDRSQGAGATASRRVGVGAVAVAVFVAGVGAAAARLLF